MPKYDYSAYRRGPLGLTDAHKQKLWRALGGAAASAAFYLVMADLVALAVAVVAAPAREILEALDWFLPLAAAAGIAGHCNKPVCQRIFYQAVPILSTAGGLYALATLDPSMSPWTQAAVLATALYGPLALLAQRSGAVGPAGR
ncbi:MAG: hypothetical protein RMK97_00660 [Sutterellaceae bacterium]|nr:hypothetical protein [Burkholderiaceae bacterium]MCX7902433.1 hypothetical protein [Burkholderiaceae bacterium]MDW8429011.1 hypothetical protein [Sutterellaceae bacterium]